MQHRRLRAQSSAAAAVALLLGACNAKLLVAPPAETSTDAPVDASTSFFDATAITPDGPDAGPLRDDAHADDANASTDAPPDTADAGPEWSETLPAIESFSLTTDHAGNLLVAGETGSFHSYVAKLAPNGHVLWTLRFTGGGQDVATGVAVNSQDNVLIAGFNSGPSLDLGGGPLGQGTYAARFTSNGAHVWSEIVSAGAGYAAITVTPTDEVVVCGALNGTNAFPGDAGVTLTGSQSGYVAKLDSTGATEWATQTFGSDGWFTAAASDVDGGVVCVGDGLVAERVDTSGAFVGWYSEPQQNGNQGMFFDVKISASGDLFLVGFESTGAVLVHLTSDVGLVSRLILGAGPPAMTATGVALDADGGIVVTGIAGLGTNLGGGPIDAAGPFVELLSGDGGYVASRAWVPAPGGAINLVRITNAPPPDYYLFGEESDPINFGQGALNGSAFAAREHL